MPYTTAEFESIYARCFPTSMRLAMSLLHAEDEARDTVQEVFIKLWESGIRVDNPPGFMIRAVRNACLNRISMLDTREKILRKISLEPPPAEFDPEERSQEVTKAVKVLLTSREQQVVEQVYTRGKSYRETAQALGISESAVNKNIVSALKKLRNHFNRL